MPNFSRFEGGAHSAAAAERVATEAGSRVNESGKRSFLQEIVTNLWVETGVLVTGAALLVCFAPDALDTVFPDRPAAKARALQRECEKLETELKSNGVPPVLIAKILETMKGIAEEQVTPTVQSPAEQSHRNAPSRLCKLYLEKANFFAKAKQFDKAMSAFQEAMQDGRYPNELTALDLFFTLRRIEREEGEKGNKEIADQAEKCAQEVHAHLHADDGARRGYGWSRTVLEILQKEKPTKDEVKAAIGILRDRIDVSKYERPYRGENRNNYDDFLKALCFPNSGVSLGKIAEIFENEKEDRILHRAKMLERGDSPHMLKDFDDITAHVDVILSHLNQQAMVEAHKHGRP